MGGVARHLAIVMLAYTFLMLQSLRAEVPGAPISHAMRNERHLSKAMASDTPLLQTSTRYRLGFCGSMRTAMLSPMATFLGGRQVFAAKGMLLG